MIRILLLGFVFYALPNIGYADWQYTQWGMNADEIVAASDGNAWVVNASEKEEKSGANFDTIALGRFETGPFKFDVSFRALKGEYSLDTVRLNLEDPLQHRRLKEALTAKYGQGEEELVDSNATVEVKRVIWTTETDTINLIHFNVKVLSRVDIYLDYSRNLAEAAL